MPDAQQMKYETQDGEEICNSCLDDYVDGPEEVEYSGPIDEFEPFQCAFCGRTVKPSYLS